MRSRLASGTRVQYTHPPNGSLNGTPSIRTSVRLTPLGPIPRRDTPWVVGCDDRLLDRRKRLNVGTCRSTSSATTAGDSRICWLDRTVTLAGTSPARCSPRVAVTATVSDSGASDRTTSRLCVRSASDTLRTYSANPPARTVRTTSPSAFTSMAKRPSGPVTACAAGPALEAAGTAATTTAPATDAPVESRTTPLTTPAGRGAAASSKLVMRKAIMMEGLYGRFGRRGSQCVNP